MNVNNYKTQTNDKATSVDYSKENSMLLGLLHFENTLIVFKNVQERITSCPSVYEEHSRVLIEMNHLNGKKINAYNAININTKKIV